MDRRVEKSKKAILEALIQLMAEKDFDKISINQIADRANVNRGTVYLHYADKFDLLDHCINTHLNQLFENCMSQENSEKISAKTAILHIFQHLEQHAFFYSNMYKKGIETFRKRLFSAVKKLVEAQVEEKGIMPNVGKELLIQYTTSAVVGVIEWWIITSMPTPYEDMVEQLWFLLERAQIIN